MTTPTPRRFLVVLEPISAMCFFSPEVLEENAKLGLDAWASYFCSRAAPMGAVSADVVAATFYNFSPDIVRPNVRWDLASPEQVRAAQLEGVRRTFVRVFDEVGGFPPMGRAIELLREAVRACPPAGRPIAGALAAQPWPTDEALGVWHGSMVLREYRGDGHVAVLVSHGVGPVEAIVLHAAYVGGKIDFLKLTRQWADEALQHATARLVDRGFMSPDGGLTDAGGKFRLMLEHDTDRIAHAPFEALGADKSEELLGLLEPIAMRLLETKAAPKFLGRMDPAHKLV
jgi:hypothetical protein